MDSTLHTTRCECEQLSVAVRGRPALVAACHCRNCQRRSGAPFFIAAWFERDQVVEIKGKSNVWSRTTDFDRGLSRHFCPTCGTSVYWYGDIFPARIGMNGGGFEDPDYVRPGASVFCRSRYAWVKLPEEIREFETQPF